MHGLCARFWQDLIFISLLWFALLQLRCGHMGKSHSAGTKNSCYPMLLNLCNIYRHNMPYLPIFLLLPLAEMIRYITIIFLITFNNDVTKFDWVVNNGKHWHLFFSSQLDLVIVLFYLLPRISLGGTQFASMRVAFLYLYLMLIYDVFWVFCSPYFFGECVM